MQKLIPPLTVLKLVKLWPHARKQGHEKGDILRVGYYCKDCGEDTVWLVDQDGKYNWTVDYGWIVRYFEIIQTSKERSIYGKGRPKLKPLTEEELSTYKGEK